MTTSVARGSSATTGAGLPNCRPKATCPATITAAAAKAATGYRRRGITVAASSAVTATTSIRTLADPAGI